MIFKQWEQITGQKQPLKTQTRRPVKDGEYGVCLHGCDYSSFRSVVLREIYRTKWAVGKTYAVQPPGKKSVGQIRITKIRREKLGDISCADVFAEGLGMYNPLDGKHYPTTALDVAQERYACLWNHIYGNGAWERMMDDDVWVLEFTAA